MQGRDGEEKDREVQAGRQTEIKRREIKTAGGRTTAIERRSEINRMT